MELGFTLSPALSWARSGLIGGMERDERGKRLPLIYALHGLCVLRLRAGDLLIVSAWGFELVAVFALGGAAARVGIRSAETGCQYLAMYNARLSAG